MINPYWGEPFCVEGTFTSYPTVGGFSQIVIRSRRVPSGVPIVDVLRDRRQEPDPTESFLPVRLTLLSYSDRSGVWGEFRISVGVSSRVLTGRLPYPMVWTLHDDGTSSLSDLTHCKGTHAARCCQCPSRCGAGT